MKNRINIFGSEVTITNRIEAPLIVGSLIKKSPGYICFPDVFVITSANKNRKLKEILNNSLVTFPDGQPLVFYAKKKGVKNMSTVSGYWLIKELLNKSCSHYFYGTDEENLLKIQNKLEFEYPSANIIGFKSPPFVSLDEIENNALIQEDINKINKLAPDIIWIGMNSPKQDYLMAHYYKHLDNSILIGVGGVFDYLSGRLKISPEWVKKLSMRWLYRSMQNPRRYFRRNMFSICQFINLYLKELFAKKTTLNSIPTNKNE